MTTSSEDVLLSVGAVKHRKYDGTLYLMTERIAWMPNGKDSFTISHKYADIKMQKISPEGKIKIQLQLVLNAGEATTFHFVSSEGQDRQVADRNEIKEILQQLLPKFKKKISKDIEEKQRILAGDPDLYQLYQDLVASQVITSEEFWTQLAPIRCPSLVQTLNITSPTILRPSLAASASYSSAIPQLEQMVGISPAFLSDIRPQTDGCNGIKYNITKDIVEAIFRTYPAVKRKHFENVPQKMDEQQFWTRFFQSHYFHRDRVFATSGSTSKSDLFADCARADELDIERAARRGINDPFVDLTGFHDSNHVHASNDDQKASPPHPPAGVGGANSIKSKSRDKDSVYTSAIQDPNKALIRRFNHHSIMVMEASMSKAKSQTNGSCSANPTAHLNGCINNKHTNSAVASNHVNGDAELEETDLREAVRLVKKRRLKEMTQLDDLEAASPSELRGTKALNITQKERYLYGPTPNMVDDYETSYGYNHEGTAHRLLDAVRHQEATLANWEPALRTCLSSTAALTALNELSPGGALLKSSYSVVLKDVIPMELQKQLKQIYFSCNELLRHFWACFPVSGERLEEKLVQTKHTLERFQFTKIQPFHDKLVAGHHNLELTNHLLSQLNIAYNKFTTWQAKKSALSRK